MDQNIIHGFESVNIMEPPTSPGAFAVQCARCLKWRYLPTKEKYEEIRAHILERPFYCTTTWEWNSNKNCDNPPDLTQEESGLKWAVDTPNIAQPPPGWKRIIKFRPKGGIRLADVYYDPPSGKRLRSKNEVEKYLEQHPEDAAQSVKLEKFSFQIPRPLQEDYVRKCHPAPSHDINDAYDGIKRYKDKDISSKNELKWKRKRKRSKRKRGDKWKTIIFSPKEKKASNEGSKKRFVFVFKRSGRRYYL